MLLHVTCKSFVFTNCNLKYANSSLVALIGHYDAPRARAYERVSREASLAVHAALTKSGQSGQSAASSSGRRGPSGAASHSCHTFAALIGKYHPSLFTSSLPSSLPYLLPYLLPLITSNVFVCLSVCLFVFPSHLLSHPSSLSSLVIFSLIPPLYLL